MQIQLTRNGTPLGTFTEDEVRAKLSRGELNGAELARLEGMTDSQPLSTILSASGGGGPSPFGAQTAPAAPADTTSGLAVGSLFCGIVGLFTFIPSLAAVIMGHIALSQIKLSQGAITGKGLAIAGLVMGYMVLAAIIASFLIPAQGMVTNQANQQKGVSNCKQIISGLLSYAADFNGMYPDSVTSSVTGRVPQTSNEAFKELFREGLITEERIFGCPASKYQPDGSIGVAPDFEQALMAHENHWALTAGQSKSSTGLMPLVFENPVSTSWPPQWNCDAAGKLVQGRAWPGHKIIVGKNDGSAEIIKLAGSTGKPVGPRLFGYGEDIFTQASGNQPQQILQITLGGGQSYSNQPGMVPGGAPGGGLPPPPPAAPAAPAAGAGAPPPPPPPPGN